MKFVYEACTKSGNVVHGTLNAQSKTAAADKLHQQGLFIISLKADGSKTKISHKILALTLTSRMKLRFLSRFAQQLSMLSRAGLPFLTCMEIIADEANHPLYRKSLIQLKHDVALGESFADSLAKQSFLFPQLLIQMTASAEATGKLEEVYSQIGSLYEKELEIKTKIVDAAAYPLFVLALAFVGILGISKLVLPQWEQLLAYSNAPWPLPTKLLLTVGQPWVWLLISTAMVIFGLLALILTHTPLGGRTYDYVILQFPILGNLLVRYHWARISYCIGLCLECGIPLLLALDIAEQASLNRSLAADLREIKTGVQVGTSLTYQLRTIKSIPKLLVPLVRVGEETGRLAQVFQRAAEMLNKDLGSTLDKVIKWLGPSLIVITGLVIGFIILGLMMPLFTLVDYLG
ncbi:MAG: type II secretion system F family protein [bacterium]|jgi:type II secretory pathway component PulF